MRTKIYLALTQQLSSITHPDGTPAIKHFEMWNTGKGAAEELPETLFPRCGVEFAPISWNTLSSGEQEALLTVRLHLLHRCTTTPSDIPHLKEHEAAALRLARCVNQTLHRFSGEGFGCISRISSTTCHSYELTADSVEAYSMHIKESCEAASGSRIPCPDPTFQFHKQ